MDFKNKATNLEETLTQKTTKGFLWLSIGRFVQAILQVVVIAILARIISPESFGIAQAALIVVGFANIISQMGIGPALVQRKNINSQHLRIGFTFSFILGFVLGSATFFGAGLIGSFFNISGLEDVVKAISCIFIIESFVVVSVSILQKKMRFKEYAAVNISSYFIGYGIFGITLGFLDYGVWALIVAFISQSLIKAIIVSYLEPHSYLPSLKKKELKELLYFGGGFTVGKFANYFAAQGDNIITGKFLGADSLGLYSRAYMIMVNPVKLIGSALDKALFPAMSSIKDDPKRMQKAYFKGVSVIATISLPLSVLIVFLSPEIVKVLLGNDWMEAVLPLQILSGGMLFRMGYKISDTFTRATGDVYKRAWRQIIYALAIFSGAYLGTFWGIAGVAVGVVCAIIINYFLMAHLCLKILNISWMKYLKAHSAGIYISIVTGSVSYFLIKIVRGTMPHEIITLLIIAFVFFVISLALIVFMPQVFLGKRNLWLLDNMKEYFKKYS